MTAAAMKHMASNFAKIDKFERVDFRRWQKKMHFLLSSMSVVYVLTTPILEDGENATMEQIRKRNKGQRYKLWEMATLVPQCDRCVCTVNPSGLTMLVLKD
ncbi:hypothetical protein Tco_0950349 [Tanacetum coccineum]